MGCDRIQYKRRVGRHGAQLTTQGTTDDTRQDETMQERNKARTQRFVENKKSDGWLLVYVGYSHSSIESIRIYTEDLSLLNGAVIRVGDDAEEGLPINTVCGTAIGVADTSSGSWVERHCFPALDGQFVSVSLQHNELTVPRCELTWWGNADVDIHWYS